MLLTPIRIATIDVITVHLPLLTPLAVAYASFPSVASVLVHIEAERGVSGWGEATPDPDVTGEDVDGAHAALAAAAGALLGRDARDRLGAIACARAALPDQPSALAAIDIALHDIVARAAGAPLWALLGGRRTTEIQVSRVIGIDRPEVMAAQAADLAAAGFGILKLKLGRGGVGVDLQRVAAVRSAVGPHVCLKVDVNQGWVDAETAATALAGLVAGDITVLEQPVAAGDLAGLAQVALASTVPVMADEAICSAAQMASAALLGACDLVNVKLMKTGGLLGALDVCAVARAHGIGAQVGTMVESSIASAAGLHLAAALPACAGVEMSGPNLLSADVAEAASWYRADRVRIPDAPGLGIEPDGRAVDRWTRRRDRIGTPR